MADPIVYGADYSTYVRSVRLALEEKGVPYRLVAVDIVSGGGRSPEHLQRHPFGKIPAFEHDGFTLHETVAINRYIDETFSGASLQPAEARARARMTQVMAIIDSYGYQPMISAVVIQRLVVSMMGGTPDEAVIADAVPQAETALAVLEQLLGDQDYFAGGALSLADLHFIPVYDYFSQTAEGKRLLTATRNLGHWWQRVKARESVVKTRPSLA
jgi:glutathione S-transferase